MAVEQPVGSQDANPLVYACTLNWNGREDTLACLEALDRLDYEPKRLLLVDNGSTDGSVAAVRARFPQVEILINERNLGFAGGCNRGIRHALGQGADYIFLINNDAVVAPDALTKMLAVAGEDVGMLAPKIYYADAPDRIWSVGGDRHPLTIEMTDVARGEKDSARWETVRDRDYFVGCALLLSRPLLAEVGLFDESFFMYYEDSDLSLRARESGFRLRLCPQAHVWHKVAVSSGGSDSPNERYWMARSSVRFFRKHVHGWRWAIVLPYRTASAVKTVARLAAHRRGKSMIAYLRGLRDGLTDVLDEG